MLIDNFGRQVTYLRISVTDRCDLRCVYCMSEEMEFIPHKQLLTLEELTRIGSAFSQLGVNKIRITGGEPLIRRNILKVFNKLGQCDNINDLTLTTNGTQLTKYAHELKQAGVTRINISLDTLKPERFKRLTRVGDINKTLDGIDAAIKQNFNKVKINAVILKNRNHDECTDLVKFAINRGADITFIEEMPLGAITEHDRAEAYYSSDQILQDLEQTFSLTPSTANTGGPSKYHQVANTNTRVGFISPHSHNFCSDCNRVRLTAEGRLLLCLGQEHSVDLRRVVRAHPTNDDALFEAIKDSMSIKPKGHDFDLSEKPVIFRHMNTTGG
jgi:cyclic pyranopterin phosphate synthase